MDEKHGPIVFRAVKSLDSLCSATPFHLSHPRIDHSRVGACPTLVRPSSAQMVRPGTESARRRADLCSSGFNGARSFFPVEQVDTLFAGSALVTSNNSNCGADSNRIDSPAVARTEFGTDSQRDSCDVFCRSVATDLCLCTAAGPGPVACTNLRSGSLSNLDDSEQAPHGNI